MLGLAKNDLGEGASNVHSEQHPCVPARSLIYCQTTGVSAAHATHCATYCTPCRPLIRAFSGWIRTPPPTSVITSSHVQSRPTYVRRQHVHQMTTPGRRLAYMKSRPVTPPVTSGALPTATLLTSTCSHVRYHVHCQVRYHIPSCAVHVRVKHQSPAGKRLMLWIKCRRSAVALQTSNMTPVFA